MIAALEPWVAAALILLALIVLSIAVYGLAWMPDVFTRLHAASKAALLGIFPLLLLLCLSGEPSMMARALLIAAFLVLTTPVATHAIGRAAYLAREVPQWPRALDESPAQSAREEPEPPASGG
jgi:multicomponent Na+:H+ antiporter subunit G